MSQFFFRKFVRLVSLKVPSGTCDERKKKSPHLLDCDVDRPVHDDPVDGLAAPGLRGRPRVGEEAPGALREEAGHRDSGQANGLTWV